MSAKIDRLRARLAELEQLRLGLIRTGQLMQLATCDKRIAAVKKDLDEAMEWEPQEISKIIPKEQLKKDNFAKLVVRTHLAADILNDAAVSLKEYLRKQSLCDCNLFKQLDKIKRLTDDYVRAVCDPIYGDLAEFIVEDGKLIDDINILIDRYFKQLKLTD